MDLVEWAFSDEPDTLSLAQILDEVEAYYTRHIRFPNEHGPVTVSLWTAETHVQDAFDVATYVNISSAEKRCGKSLVLELAEQVVRKPLRVDNASPAYVYRTMAGATLLMDEADKVFTGKDEYFAALTGALNSGWRRGAGAGRVDKGAEGLKPVRFDAFRPKMLAGIGRRVPDTIQDRSIPLFLQRKAPGERVTRVRYRKLPVEAGPIREALSRWAAMAVEELSGAEPDLPEELHDRAQDIWEPLLAIADLAGDGWPKRARAAAVSLHGAYFEDDSNGVRLLRDIQSAFSERGIDRISSADLASALNDLEESPWGGWPMDQRKLARDLRPFGIRPGVVRVADGKTPRGYPLDQFGDAWMRYLDGPIRGTATSATSATPQVALTSIVADVADVAEVEEPDPQGFLEDWNRRALDHARQEGLPWIGPGAIRGGRWEEAAP